MQLNMFEDYLNLKTVKLLIGITCAAFIILTVVTIAQFGLINIFYTQFQTLGGIQVFVDLVIMCLLFSAWIRFDAKKNGRLFFPWFLLTLAAGAIGPLLYLITRKVK